MSAVKVGRLFLIAALWLGCMQGATAREEESAKRLEADLAKVGRSVEKGLHEGGEAVAKGARKAGGWLGKQMQQGGKKLEKAGK